MCISWLVGWLPVGCWARAVSPFAALASKNSPAVYFGLDITLLLHLFFEKPRGKKEKKRKRKPPRSPSSSRETPGQVATRLEITGEEEREQQERENRGQIINKRYGGQLLLNNIEHPLYFGLELISCFLIRFPSSEND